MTFFDLTGSSMWTDIPERKLQFDKTGVIEALPRDRDTWMVIDDKAWFFALTDQVSIAEAEEFAQKLAQWRLAEAYEEIGQRVAHIGAETSCPTTGLTILATSTSTRCGLAGPTPWDGRDCGRRSVIAPTTASCCSWI